MSGKLRVRYYANDKHLSRFRKLSWGWRISLLGLHISWLDMNKFKDFNNELLEEK